MGEVMFRGNLVMKGYLARTLQGNARTRFCGRVVPFGRPGGASIEDGYVQLKDRSKDIIISGGENISSIEVEDVIYASIPAVQSRVLWSPSQMRSGARRRAPSWS